MPGLAIDDIVNVTVNLSPLAAGYRNFGAAVILGSTEGVIDTAERIRQYSGLDGVAQDFGTTAPEYLAASKFFSQVPRPNLLYIARWAQSASHGVLHGAVLSPAQQVMSNFTGVTNGSFTVTVDGTLRTITAVNLSSATNLNAVASAVQAALIAGGATGASVTWDALQKRFNVMSGTTGASSTVGYFGAAGSGTDLTPLMRLGTGVASVPVAGVIAETLLNAVQTLADKSNKWYGLTVATSTPPSDNDYLNTAAYIEGSPQSRIFGITITNPNVLDSTTSADLGSSLKTANYKRTVSQYSASSPYAIASLLGRAFTVNFEGSRTTLTIKFKQEPGVVAEDLTETQAATLKAKNVNVFVSYENDVAIIQDGVMANGNFFDEVHGTDWLQNAVQIDLFNVLYQSQTKIPQTDDGIHILKTTVEHTMARAVNNGLVAPGLWNVDGFGQLKQGDMLTSGFYVYAPLVASQPQADREARKAPPIQVAAKLAGAVHSANVLISVNR